MNTMDDEMRATLREHAREVPPPLGVFDRVEAAAKRMRRNRVAASVGGAVAAVAAVAIAVPIALSGSSHQGVATPPPSATSTTPTPTEPTPQQSRYVLNAAKPWPYRGDQKATAPAVLDKFQRDWAARHPGSTLRPLWGEIYEPSQQPEIVFVAQVGDSAHWGMVKASPSGSQFVVDKPLADGTRVLPVVAPGDEVARLLVVASPEVTEIQYAGDGVSFKDMAQIAPGVAVAPLEGDQAVDQIKVIGPDDDTVYQGAAPNSALVAAPANLLSWPTRGTVPTELLQAATDAYAQSRQQSAAAVQTKVFYGGVDAAGTQYVLAQAWISGDQAADTVGYLKRPDGTDELQLKARVATGVPAVVLDVTDSSAGPTETLVVVPQPTTGQVLYAASPTAKFTPVSSDRFGISIVARGAKAQGDRLQVLDGDGRTTFEGSATSLLCGVTSCG